MHNTLTYCILFISLFVGTTSADCSMLVTDFSQDDCISKGENSEGSYYFDLDKNTCIPNCKQYDIKCCSHQKCAVGYTCQKLYDTSNDTTKCDSYCVKGPCMIYNIKNFKDYYNARFKPSCNNDGTWKAKQCKGGVNGRCLCFDSKGTRIFGEALFSDAENMTCACSRRHADLASTREVTFHCDSMGNYEPLQCDQVSKQCWCVEPTTGNLVYPIVPEKALQLLPCYSSQDYGSQYLRQCESKKYALIRIKEKLNAHGVTYVSQDLVLCDNDGSYGAFKVEKDNALCTWRNNSIIGSWQANIQKGYGDLNCNCARDFLRYGSSQICLSNGNYKPLQHDLTNYYCVDTDGFAKSEILSNLDDPKDSYCDNFY